MTLCGSGALGGGPKTSGGDSGAPGLGSGVLGGCPGAPGGGFLELLIRSSL